MNKKSRGRIEAMKESSKNDKVDRKVIATNKLKDAMRLHVKK